MTGGARFEFGAVTYSEIDDAGFIGVQVGLFGEGAGAPPGEMMHPYGFFSRPPDPELDVHGEVDPTKACEAVYAWEGDRLHVLPIGDARTILRLPSIQKGDSLIYSSCGAFVRANADGSCVLFTTDNGKFSGRSVYAEVAPTHFKRIAPWGSESFDAMGFHLKHAAGAELRMGGIYGLPEPADKLTSYVTLQAASIAIEASMLALGADTGTYLPVAVATPLQALLLAIQAWIKAVSAAIATTVAASGITDAQRTAIAALLPPTQLPPAIASTVTASFSGV